MSRGARTQNSVSLFPFLAVLVCAMGALIFLLLVTTRRIRDDVRRKYEHTVAVIPEAPPSAVDVRSTPFVPPTPAILPDDPDPVPPAVTLDPEPDLEPVARPEPPVDPNVALRRTIAALERELATRRTRAENARTTIAASEETRTRLEADVARTLAELARRKRELTDLLAEAARLETEQERIEGEYASLGDRLRRARDQPDEPDSRFAFVPYDGRSGTTRRPIYIECTKEGLRFLPEGLLLTEDDLVGFTYAVNPLLAGARALVDHWEGTDDEAGRPYVLLLVRPGGAAAYYAARTLLERLGEPFGYEIVPDDFEVAMPDPDPLASRILRDETTRLIAERDRLALAAGGGGTGDGPGNGGPGNGGPKNGLFPGELRPGEIASAARDRVGTRGGGGDGPGGEGDGDGPRIVGLNRPPVGIGAGRPGRHVVREYPRRSDTDDPRGNNPRGNGPNPDDVVGSPDPRGTPGGGPGGRRIEATPIASPDGDPNATPGPEGGRPGGRPWDGGLIDNDPQTIDELFPKPDEDDSPFGGPRPDDVFERATHGHPGQRGHGGLHPAVSRGGIGIEKPVLVEVFGDRLVIGERYTQPYERGQRSDDLVSAIVAGVDRTVAGWGRPPRGFHWVPTVKFRVHRGGNVQYERIHGRLRRSKLKTSVEYALEATPDAAKP